MPSVRSTRAGITAVSSVLLSLARESQADCDFIQGDCDGQTNRLLGPVDVDGAGPAEDGDISSPGEPAAEDTVPASFACTIDSGRRADRDGSGGFVLFHVKLNLDATQHAPS